MNEPIGIIAGGGQFPLLAACNARENGLSPIICGFQGHTDPALENAADAFCLVHLGQFNKVIQFFRKHGVRRLCMAGAVNKPRALDFRPDFRAVRIIFSLRRKGDDSLLRAIITDFENEGFTVIPASDLVPSLRCPPGVLSRRSPAPEEWDDIRYGWPIGVSLGRFDIGQCLVVRQGMVVSVECLEGTDATLNRGAELGGAGCVALKMVKPGQDERVDLPSIGLTTIRLLCERKYRCLAVEADKTLFFDPQEALALADRHDLAVVALTPDEIAAFAAPGETACSAGMPHPQAEPVSTF